MLLVKRPFADTGPHRGHFGVAFEYPSKGYDLRGTTQNPMEYNVGQRSLRAMENTWHVGFFLKLQPFKNTQFLTFQKHAKRDFRGSKNNGMLARLFLNSDLTIAG